MNCKFREPVSSFKINTKHKNDVKTSHVWKYFGKLYFNGETEDIIEPEKMFCNVCLTQAQNENSNREFIR